MDLLFQRKIDRIVGSLLCAGFSLFARNSVPRRKPLPQKILVILLSEMGSLVLACPMFEKIRKTYGTASIFVLAFERNREVVELLELVPSDHLLTVSDVSFGRFLTDSLRVVRKMRRIGIDTVIDCELFSRVSSIFSFLSGAVIRSGFYRFTQEGLYRGSFINRPVLYNPYRHISAQFVSLVRAIESGGRPPVKERLDGREFRAPRIRLSRSDMAAFQKRFAVDFPGVSGKKLVLLYPGGGLLPIRAWPAEKYSAVVHALAGRGYAVGIIGMGNDRPLARAILSGAPEEACVDLTGYTRTVKELLMLFHRAALLITNDGGPGHFASLTPIPSIIFFGPETPVLYGTLDEKSVEFYTGISCSPCLTAYNHRNSPCDGDNVCLKSISVQSVLKTACEILEGTGAS